MRPGDCKARSAETEHPPPALHWGLTQLSERQLGPAQPGSAQLKLGTVLLYLALDGVINAFTASSCAVGLSVIRAWEFCCVAVCPLHLFPCLFCSPLLFTCGKWTTYLTGALNTVHLPSRFWSTVVPAKNWKSLPIISENILLCSRPQVIVSGLWGYGFSLFVVHSQCSLKLCGQICVCVKLVNCSCHRLHVESNQSSKTTLWGSFCLTAQWNVYLLHRFGFLDVAKKERKWGGEKEVKGSSVGAKEDTQNIFAYHSNNRGQMCESFKTPETRICYSGQWQQGLSGGTAGMSRTITSPFCPSLSHLHIAYT